MRQEEYIVGIGIILAFLLPHTNILFLLVNPLICLYLSFYFKRRGWKPFVLVVLVPIVLSMLLNTAGITTKALQSTVTIILTFAMFPFVGRVRVRSIFLFIPLIYIIASQIIYLMGVSFLTSFFDTYYPIDEDFLASNEYMQSNITYNTIFNYRLGGLYHNSNQCSKYLTMLLAFFLVETSNYTSYRNKILFIVLTYASVLLTGSRTGFVVASLLVYFGFLRSHRHSVFLRLLVGAIIVAALYYILGSGVELRSMEIEDGMQDSVGAKWVTFLYYLSSEPPLIYTLFGYVDESLFTGGPGNILTIFDSEYGSLIFRYGFIGIICILYFYWLVWRKMQKQTWIFFIVLLWMATSCIIASYRTSFVFMLLLSVIYANNRKVRTPSK